VNTPHSPFEVVKTIETFRSDMSTYVKVAHGGVHVCQTSAEMRLFCENLHVVTSRNWYNFVETRHIG